MSDQIFTEPDLAKMNRYELEEYLNKCKEVAEALNSNAYSTGPSEFRYLKHRVELVEAEIATRRPDPVFWTKNSLRKIGRGASRIYRGVRAYIFYDLLMKRRNLVGWMNFVQEISSWSDEELCERGSTLDQCSRRALVNSDGTKISDKQLCELFIEELILDRELEERSIRQAINIGAAAEKAVCDDGNEWLR